MKCMYFHTSRHDTRRRSWRRCCLVSSTALRQCARTSWPAFLQLYYDIFKLLRKTRFTPHHHVGVRANPPISLAAVIAVLALIPMAQIKAPVSFMGDFILLAYALGLTRFLTILAALDTGSSLKVWAPAARSILRPGGTTADPGTSALAYATGQFPYPQFLNAVCRAVRRTAGDNPDCSSLADCFPDRKLAHPGG